MSQQIPAPGLGTWKLEDEQCEESVETAIDIGYRHIDTAQVYENEAEVGAAIAASDIPRDDLFIATKVWHSKLSPDHLRRSTEGSLKKLGLDRVDLLYIHWPSGEYSANDTLPALRELQEEGLTDHLGLSNFTPGLLEEAIDILGEPPAAHQVETHPHLQQRKLRDMAVEHDMVHVSYSPLKRTELFDNEVIQTIADEQSASPAQVVLAWHMSKKNVVPIPKATGADHLRDNFEAQGLSLTAGQLDRIDQLDAGDRAIDPPFAPW